MNGLLGPSTWALLFLLVSTAVLIVAPILLGRRDRLLRVREVEALSDLREHLNRAAEAGKPLHIALGTGGIGSINTASSLAGLQLLEALVDAAVSFDVAPIVTVGHPTLLPLAQDILRRAYERSHIPEFYDPTRVRFVAPSALAYGAGAIPVGAPEDVTANVTVGAFGTEASLLADFSDRRRTPKIAAVDTIEAIGALHPATSHLAIGEELYAAPAQVAKDKRYDASLVTHDILRFVLAGVILLGALVALIAG